MKTVWMRPGCRAHGPGRPRHRGDPEETAVAICAEIISLRAGAPRGASLSRTGGPIHHQRVATDNLET